MRVKNLFQLAQAIIIIKKNCGESKINVIKWIRGKDGKINPFFLIHKN